MQVVLSIALAACLLAAALAADRVRRRRDAQPAGKPPGTRRRWGRRWRAAAVLAAATGALMAAGLPSASAAAKPTATSTTLSVPPGATAGSPVTITAAVQPAPAGGSVSFSAIGPTKVSLPTACTAAPVVAGVATCTFTPAAATAYELTAAYSGTAGFKASASKPVSLSVAAAPVTTTETVSDNAASVAQGDPVVFTAVISAADGTVPAGSVSWTVSSTTSLADSFCASTTYSNGTATCTVNTYLDTYLTDGVWQLGGWDGQGHDLTAGDITATAAFTPAGPGYASASASDSTVKVTSIVYDPPSSCCEIDTSGTLSLSASQTTLPPDQVEWAWQCYGTGECSWESVYFSAGTLNLSTSPAVTFTVIAATIHVSPIACPAGVNPLSGFTCAQGPQDTINFLALQPGRTPQAHGRRTAPAPRR